MAENARKELFVDYYDGWVEDYKANHIDVTTLWKYRTTGYWLRKIAPELCIVDLNRREYQKIINEYAKTHEKTGVKGFHTHLKSAILDAIDDGILTVNPCRKVIIKGMAVKKEKKIEYLSRAESQKLVMQLDLVTPLNDGSKINWNWFFFICLKTGIRFAEVLGLTPEDFDFNNRILHINKTLDYKVNFGEFKKTKTQRSNRKILMDYSTTFRLQQEIKDLPRDKSIFLIDKERVFNSTVGNRLRKLCIQAEIPIISIKGLRHTHASLLLMNGVSINSISRRLGHENVTVTQETYLHIIKELEEQDGDKIMMALAAVG